jgi:multidrug efflux pump subunit AcrA (membrane-fusion protein)
MMYKLSTFPIQYTLRYQTSGNTSKSATEEGRAALDAVLAREKSASATISASSNLEAEISRTQDDLRAVLTFLDGLLQTLNVAVPDSVVSDSDIAGYKTLASGARTSINAALASLTAADQALKNAHTGASGGNSSSAAALKQAEASLASARATFEHTVIRSPISGTINSLPLKLGDYVQIGTPVLTVANNDALEVVTYVTEADARELKVGSIAAISGNVQGTVTRVAPAIDPTTKKIEVRIGITSNSASLVNGQSVTINLRQATSTQMQAPTRLIIPLSAVKIGVDDMVVFTLAQDMTLVPHAVVLGTLMGDRVEITGGLTPDMQIVVDARGLRPGEKVVVR